MEDAKTMNTMAFINVQPQTHKSFTLGGPAVASKRTRRLLRTFALLTISAIGFCAVPGMASEWTETQTRDTCKLTGSSHYFKKGHTLVLTAMVSPEYSEGEFIFFEDTIDTKHIVRRIEVSGGEAKLEIERLNPRTYVFYGLYIPEAGVGRRTSTGCESNGWVVVAP
jgi:hypothetical protein